VDNLTYLIFALVKFHVFNDGNKRSSIALGTYLLELNGYNITKKFVMEMEIDPRGEWIPEQLRGYRLQGDPEPVYVPITNNQSTELQLQLVVEEKIIAFYRLDDGAKLLPIAFGASEAKHCFGRTKCCTRSTKRTHRARNPKSRSSSLKNTRIRSTNPLILIKLP
jgi:hypothetical protein